MGETSESGARRRLRSGRQIIDDVYLRADRVLDGGQRRAFRFLWFFLPETSVAKDPRFQQVFASRFFSDAGQQALAYGALIAVVREGGSAFDAALVGVAALLPAALFGLYGGAVADALPKRAALAVIYNLQALLCFLVPSTIGTDLTAVLLLILAVNTLGQVSGPTESSVLPLVASQEQLASAASLVSLASSAGTAFGTALLAPVLVRAFGVDTVMYVAGGLLLVAATRVFDLPTRQRRRRADWRRPTVGVSAALHWLVEQRAVATMIAVSVLAGTASIVLQTLAPRYVQSVLNVDAADAVYVLAPSSVGLLAALAATPAMIRARGERAAAVLGFACTTLSLVLLGLVNEVAAVVDPVNPVRLLSLAGLDLGEGVRTAGLLSIPLGFGLALTATSVQTYINRRVPIALQGRAFALQSTLKNGTAIAPLLVLGAAASTFGVERVLIASPFVLLVLACALVLLSARFGGGPMSFRLDAVASFWEEPDVAGEAVASDAGLPPQPEHQRDSEHQPA